MTIGQLQSYADRLKREAEAKRLELSQLTGKTKNWRLLFEKQIEVMLAEDNAVLAQLNANAFPRVKTQFKKEGE